MLRDFQARLVAEVNQRWADGARNLCLVSPTGSGKTVMLGHILKAHNGPAVVMAHRQELISQLSLALNREAVPHGLICPDDVQRQIVRLHMDTHGYSQFLPRAPVRVAGVQSFGNVESTDPWVQSVTLAVIDEGHHVLRENSYGRAMDLFRNARGLFPTAHAVRADGKGLGRQADGLVDALVIGPSARELIDLGLLCDYRLIAPPDDTDLEDVPVTASGDFSLPKLRDAVHRNRHIVGDIVEHYQKFAAGKLGITFTVDLEAAAEVARAYQAAGIPAEVISGDTPTLVRAQLMRRFRQRDILQLCNCEVLTEGVDVPAVEVVSMARHTHSFQLYSQMFGRALRLMLSEFDTAVWNDLPPAERLARIAASRKPKAIILDHVQNYTRHGLPDVPQVYSLERRTRRKRGAAPDAIPLRACLNPLCLMPYEAVLVACPHCGMRPVPQKRSSPEHVDGDLVELDAAALAALRGEIARIDGAPVYPPGLPAAAGYAIRNQHHDRQQAQAALRARMALWMGWQREQRRETSEAQRRFFHQFHIDVGTAQTLGTTDAQALQAQIDEDLARNQIVEKTV